MCRQLARIFLLVFAVSVMAANCDAKILSCTQKSERKIALVIGNGLYDSNHFELTAPNLVAPPNDAEAVGRSLCDQGFAYVDIEVNRTTQDLNDDLASFRAQINPDTKVALIFYSGHGAQIAGMNYIIPTDPGATLSDPALSGLPVSEVIASLGPPRDDLARILVFDACRNDNSADTSRHEMPPARSPAQDVNLLVEWSSTSGLTSYGHPIGTLNVSPYTWAFLAALQKTNLEIPRLHELANETAILYARQHFDPAQISVPEPSGQLAFGVYYYQPIAGGPRPELPMASEILEAFDAVGTDTRLKARPSTVDGSGMTVSQLLASAREALQHPLMQNGQPVTDASGQVRRAPNFADAARYWQLAADQGSVVAMRRLGDLYYNGHGVDLNQEKACALYAIVAQHNDPLGYERLAGCYRDGKGVPRQDLELAERHYQHALDMGLREANADLAFMLLQGTHKNSYEAFAKFKEATTAEIPESYAWLGWCYFQGVGTTRNTQEAIRLFRKAAEVGDVQGMEWLATLEQSGYGNPRDGQAVFAKAVTMVDVWFIKEWRLDDD